MRDDLFFTVRKGNEVVYGVVILALVGRGVSR